MVTITPQVNLLSPTSHAGPHAVQIFQHRNVFHTLYLDILIDPFWSNYLTVLIILNVWDNFSPTSGHQLHPKSAIFTFLIQPQHPRCPIWLSKEFPSVWPGSNMAHAFQWTCCNSKCAHFFCNQRTTTTPGIQEEGQVQLSGNKNTSSRTSYLIKWSSAQRSPSTNS